MSALDGDLTALYDYDPPVNAHGSAIVVRKGKARFIFPAADRLEISSKPIAFDGW